jgi:hypothetical protein
MTSKRLLQERNKQAESALDATIDKMRDQARELMAKAGKDPTWIVNALDSLRGSNCLNDHVVFYGMIFICNAFLSQPKSSSVMTMFKVDNSTKQKEHRRGPRRRRRQHRQPPPVQDDGELRQRRHCAELQD